jgi:hypothetical protein
VVAMASGLGRMVVVCVMPHALGVMRGFSILGC